MSSGNSKFNRYYITYLLIVIFISSFIISSKIFSKALNNSNYISEDRYDLNNSGTPQSGSTDIAIKDKFVFISCYSDYYYSERIPTLEIWNINEPKNSLKINSFNTTNKHISFSDYSLEIGQIEVVNDTIIQAVSELDYHDSNNLIFYNISNPLSPEKTNFFKVNFTSGYITELKSYQDNLFLLSSKKYFNSTLSEDITNSCFIIYENITNNIVETGRFYDNDLYYLNLQKHNNLVYIIGSNNQFEEYLVILNITDVKNINLLSKTKLGQRINYCFDIKDDYLFISNIAQDLIEIYDCSNKSAIQILKTIPYYGNIYIKSNFCFVVHQKITILDITC